MASKGSSCAAGRGERFVFATSTTQGHQLLGEERFSVEWHKADDSVWWEHCVLDSSGTRRRTTWRT